MNAYRHSVEDFCLIQVDESSFFLVVVPDLFIFLLLYCIPVLPRSFDQNLVVGNVAALGAKEKTE